MPNRWPINSGSWSDPLIWSGSIIPTASDAVFLNNRVITLDQNIQVISINNSAVAGTVAGGRVEIYGNFNISASFIRANGANTSTAPISAGPGLISFYGTGSSTITAQLNGSGTEYGPTTFNGSTGTMNIIGNVFAPSNTGNGAAVVINGSTGTVNIIGNVSSPNNNAQNYGIVNSFGIINITGNVTAGSSNGTNPTILNQNIGIVNVTGNVFGTPIGVGTTPQNAITHNSINIVNITGNVQGARTPGIASTSANIINIIGQCIASVSSSAVSSTSTTATNLFTGPFINSGSRNAIYCHNVQLYDDVTTRYTIGVSGSSNTISLLSPDQVVGVPSGSDVRFGTIYGPGNELTGSMRVPHPNSVSVGVAVDTTSGSAITKPEDLWNYAVTSLTASNSIGQRLANSSTSQSMAAVVSAFG
jgi:hypothetical protein